MNERKKKRFPTDRNKLHELHDKLVREIAEKQACLEEVTRLARQADNTAIVDIALNYNVTPEEFAEIMQQLRTKVPGADILPVRKPEPAESEDLTTDPEEMTDDEDDEDEEE